MSNELEILFKDEYFVVINKPSGMVVHPGQGGDYRAPCALKVLKKQINQWLYPVHRLDRPTSGILIFGLNKEVTSKLMQSWSDTKKKYYALICGDYKEDGEFTFDLKARDKIDRDTGEKKDIWQNAHTIYWPKEQYPGKHCPFTFCDIEIKTGRMHQIRRHFARCVTPLAGDTKYGKGKFNRDLRERYNIHRLYLHCHTLEFKHPVSQEVIRVNCPLPDELKMSSSL